MVINMNNKPLPNIKKVCGFTFCSISIFVNFTNTGAINHRNTINVMLKIGE